MTQTDLLAIVEVLAAGSWSGPPTDHAVLDYDGRRRRRIVVTGQSQNRYLLDLAKTAHLREGDGLKLGDGGIVMVVAKPEPLMEVCAETPGRLLRLAWHIGNRHLAAAISAERILIRRDHVVGHMLEHLGAQVRNVDAPFDPEGGAYDEHVHAHGPNGHHDH